MTSSKATEAAQPHPMIPVPEAIRRVLEETAKTILSSNASDSYDMISSQASASELLGRIVAEDLLMREPGYPPYRASIMDGYVIRSDEYKPKEDGTDQQWTHQVSGRVHAGPSTNPAAPDSSSLPSAVYVTTGARIPDSYDCVVPIELIDESADKANITISSKASVEPKKWIRNVGCDIEAGSVVIPAGSCIHPVSLGLLQQSGQTAIKVIRKTKVGVLSTGNELLVSTDSWSNQQENGGLIQTGQIPDVNKPILLSLLSSLGSNSCEPVDLGMERDDDIDSMTRTIERALQTCDFILTTGGISMGETDIVEDVLVGRLGGKLHFGRLNMKPGKPTTFVSIHPKENASPKPCLVFALPGNPVSATVCTHLLVRPALDMLTQYKGRNATQMVVGEMVQNAFVPPELVATLTHDIKLDMERPEYHRVVLNMELSSNGAAMVYTATSTGVQRSSRLMSLRDAQGLLVLPRGTESQPKALAGQQFTVLLLENHHSAVKFKDSKHLNHTGKPSRAPTKVAITQVSENRTKYPLIADDELSERVAKALSGSRSGSTFIASIENIDGSFSDVKKYFDDSHISNQADFWVVACSGSFPYSLQVSEMIRGKVGKVADALALQARRGAAAQDGTAALFDPVVGFIKADKSDGGCMLIALPLKGLDGGLENVRGLLKHAVNVARGKPHHHHHKHQH
ncbi:Molybdenum cofactor biosynthesis protein [Seminavis robusta]|uniref:molybdopterin adenylyltransferase n=1 Tax=Seminavis robusta TaxID=568900 RepID=A0A9N8HPC6_9STRA|nr:Molybdenum cofactor biosynthesis protein [Seminavis robusta]|eukprot:Sro891_g216850.1 Molybdenum cofactor biosynthesis protein (685) ;mRNA; f:34217-36271